MDSSFYHFSFTFAGFVVSSLRDDPDYGCDHARGDCWIRACQIYPFVD